MAKSSTLKVARRTEPPGAKKTKTSVSLTEEAIKRLGAACTVHQMDQSEVVEWLINRNLSGYVIQVRGPKIGLGLPDDQSDLSGPVIAEGSAEIEGQLNYPARVRA